MWGITQKIEDRVNSIRPALSTSGNRFKKLWKRFKAKHRIKLTTEESMLLHLFHSGKDAFSFGSDLELCKTVYNILPVKAEDLDIQPPITRTEWEALQRLVGHGPTTSSLVNSTLDMVKRPLIVLGDDRVLLGDLSNALDQVWRVYDEEAKKDQSFFRGNINLSEQHGW